MKALIGCAVVVSSLSVVGWAQCPMTAGVTPQPTAISLELVVQEVGRTHQRFAQEVASLAIQQRTEVAGSGEVFEETLYVQGNRYRLEKTQLAPERGPTLVYVFDGQDRWVVTPGGQRAKTSAFDGPQPYEDWTRWLGQGFGVDGIGQYRNRPVLMLSNPEAGTDGFSEIWFDAERLFPVVARRDTLFDRVVTVFSDQRLLTDTRFGYIPWTREVYTNGELVEVTRVTSVEANLDLDPAMFVVEEAP